MPRWLIVLAWSVALSPSFAQLPTAGALSDRDRPLFLAEVGRGVVVGDEFFYMANVQDDKQSGFDPIVILRIPL
jgi:hypothetical protein